MTDPVSVIALALSFDRDPTNGACRILRALHDAGLEIVPRQERTLQANFGAITLRDARVGGR